MISEGGKLNDSNVDAFAIKDRSDSALIPIRKLRLPSHQSSEIEPVARVVSDAGPEIIEGVSEATFRNSPIGEVELCAAFKLTGGREWNEDIGCWTLDCCSTAARRR